MTCTATAYPVTIDYTQSLREMIAAGKYDDVGPDITAQRFPLTGEGTVTTTVSLVHFAEPIGSAEASEELEKMCLRPAPLEHLLALHAQHPEVLGELELVALGSSWVQRTVRYIPCLDGWNRQRKLGLTWHGLVWDNACRFLATPN